MTTTVKDAELVERRLQVHWSDARQPTTLPLFWLRENCPCPACLHPETRQRLVDTLRIPRDISARDIRVHADGRALQVTWEQDAHVSDFSTEFLGALRSDPEHLPIEIETWDAQSFATHTPAVPYEGYLGDDAVLGQFLAQVARHGFCFVEGAPATPEATRAVAQRISYIRETIFGGYWDFTANMEHADTAYTSMAIGPHTDGTYSLDAPGYQMFHCLATECTGGENVLIDGFRIAQAMQHEFPDQYQTLTQVAIPGQYVDLKRGIHLMARRPLFRLDDSGRLAQVTYNNYDRAPFVLDEPHEQLFYDGLATLARLCADPRWHYRRRLLPGSVLLFDNWRVLHARDAYTGYRRLAGAYLNREDVQSRLRVLHRPRGTH